MADGKTYGLTFPFVESYNGKYLDLSDYPAEEIRSNLIHLLLTRKGTRYFLPDFGTALLEYIFEPLDGPTFKNIESEIRESCEKYLPQLKITNITIKAASSEETDFVVTTNGDAYNREYAQPGLNPTEYTAKVKIEYVVTDDVFNSKDFVILNI